MKINQIVSETTTSGSVATVDSPLMSMQSRNASVYGDKKVGSLFKGKKTKKPFANSISESKQVEEAKLDEDDLIIVPGQSKRLKTGFIPHDQDRTDHEVEMALSDLFQAAKNAKKTYMILKNRTEDQGIEGWVQEKIIKANDYLNTIREYLEHKEVAEGGLGALAGGIAGAALTKSLSGASLGSTIGSSLEDNFESKFQGGVIASGMAGESVAEGFGDIAKGINRLAKGKPSKGEVATKHTLKAIGAAQAGDMKTAGKEAMRWEKVKNLPKKGVAESQLDEKFKSKQQAKLMYAVAGDKDVAKKTGVSQKVAKEFVKKSHGQQVGKLPTKVAKKD